MLLNCGVGEDSESPLDCKVIKPVNPKGNQSWIFIGRTDAEAPILWPPDTKNWLAGKDPDAGKDWRWEEKGMTGWDGWMASPTWWTWLWASSVGDGQGSLVCCNPWGRKELDTTERLNWTDLSLTQFLWIKIFWVFVTWLKVEPSNHDSELKEMSELFILGGRQCGSEEGAWPSLSGHRTSACSSSALWLGPVTLL